MIQTCRESTGTVEVRPAWIRCSAAQLSAGSAVEEFCSVQRSMGHSLGAAAFQMQSYGDRSAPGESDSWLPKCSLFKGDQSVSDLADLLLLL